MPGGWVTLIGVPDPPWAALRNYCRAHQHGDSLCQAIKTSRSAPLRLPLGANPGRAWVGPWGDLAVCPECPVALDWVEHISRVLVLCHGAFDQEHIK